MAGNEDTVKTSNEKEEANYPQDYLKVRKERVVKEAEKRSKK